MLEFPLRPEWGVVLGINHSRQDRHLFPFPSEVLVQGTIKLVFFCEDIFFVLQLWQPPLLLLLRVWRPLPLWRSSWWNWNAAQRHTGEGVWGKLRLNRQRRQTWGELGGQRRRVSKGFWWRGGAVPAAAASIAWQGQAAWWLHLGLKQLLGILNPPLYKGGSGLTGQRLILQCATIIIHVNKRHSQQEERSSSSTLDTLLDNAKKVSMVYNYDKSALLLVLFIEGLYVTPSTAQGHLRALIIMSFTTFQIICLIMVYQRFLLQMCGVNVRSDACTASNTQLGIKAWIKGI